MYNKFYRTPPPPVYDACQPVDKKGTGHSITSHFSWLHLWEHILQDVCHHDRCSVLSTNQLSQKNNYCRRLGTESSDTNFIKNRYIAYM